VRRWIAVLLVLGLSARARADKLDEIRALEAALEYEQALTLVEQVIASGASNASQLAPLHFEAGKLAAGLDREAVAEQHFARALALRPDLQLDTGTSPKVVAPFEAARARAKPLRLVHSQEGRRFIVEPDDPTHLVAAVHIGMVDTRTEQPVDRDTRTGPPFTFDLPPDTTPPLEVSAVDEFGNTVASDRLGSYVRASAVRPAPHTSWYGSWKLWAGTAVFAGGIAGLCAWRERVAQDDWNTLNSEPGMHDYSELRSVEDRGRSWALAANIGFGVAGAAAIVTAIALVTHRSEPAVTVTAGPGTVGVAGRF
jgi:hypothetical protein